jgi:cell division protein FtsW
MMATRKEGSLRYLRRGVFPLLVILVPVAALIVLEPDLSSAARLLLVCGVVAFIGGARIGHFLLMAFLMFPVLLAAVLAEPYRVGRLLTFVKMLLAILGFGEEAAAEASWQITQSIIGIGSGQLFGVGFGEGMQKLGYLPHAFSDFIFSTIGEEWGFIGAVVMLILYSLYVGIGFHIARTAVDRFGMLLATGITVLIGLTAMLHIAVTLALAPTTGLPLPFVSYGGSDLVVSLIGTGLLVSIANRRGRT